MTDLSGYIKLDDRERSLIRRALVVYGRTLTHDQQAPVVREVETLHDRIERGR